MAAALLGFSAWSPASAGPVSDLYSIPVRTLEGKAGTLEPYRGKALLVVNTASECGFTPQYEGLQRLHERYAARGLAILGFPSNDFGGQEPGSNEQIRYFCKGTYHVEFPMFEKTPVTGDGIHPVYSWLLNHAADPSPVQWNFEKILVGRDGKVLQRFRSSVKPESPELTRAIEAALAPSARKR